MKKRLVLAVVAAILSIVALGCAPKRDLSDAQVRVWLTTPVEHNVAKNQEFRINVSVQDAHGNELRGLKVVAEVLDAVNASLGKYPCKPLVDKPGRYQSDPFVPPQQAQAGAWTVNAIVGQDDNSASGSVTVQVGESLGAQAQVQHGFSLNIPPSWDIFDQQTTAQGGLLRLTPLPAGSDAQALVEIRYTRGKSEVSDKTVRDALLAFRPTGYDQGTSLVRHVVAVQVEGHAGLLARGSFITDLGQGKVDLTYAVDVLKFYCDATDRTFTIIKVSTSDQAMAQMSAVLDELQCHLTR